MKNIIVFSFLVIIITFFNPINSAHCQDRQDEASAGEEHIIEDAPVPHGRNYGFSFGTQFGFVYGQILELVYPVPGGTRGELLSELIWDMKPVFYYGFQFDFNRINLMSAPGFFASVSFKTGVPVNSGIMEDRDWLSIENDALTYFSRHTNKTREFYWLDAVIGASIPVRSYFYIKPFLSGSWMFFSFTGRDGYGIYAKEKSQNSNTFHPIENNPDKKTYSGEVIRYQQNWLLLATGFSIGTDILSPFSFEFTFQISPFTYCAAKDQHLTRNTVFMDFTYWGLFIEPRASISFTLNRFEFSLEAGFRYIRRTTGESFINKDNAGFYRDENKAGAGISALDMRLLVKVRL